jgi:hypothetical protein
MEWNNYNYLNIHLEKNIFLNNETLQIKFTNFIVKEIISDEKITLQEFLEIMELINKTDEKILEFDIIFNNNNNNKKTPFNFNYQKRSFHTTTNLSKSYKKIKIVKDKWINKIYEINKVDNYLDDLTLINILLKFKFKLLKTNITLNHYIFLLLRIKKLDGRYITLSYIQKFILNEFDSVKDALMKFYYQKSAYYEWVNVADIIISYKICSKDTVIEKSKIVEPIEYIREKEGDKIINYFNFSGTKLINTMDYSLWGKIIYQEKNVVIVKKIDSIAEYIINFIKIVDKDNKLKFYSQTVDLRYDDAIVLSFKDVKDNFKKNTSLNTFTRYIKKGNYEHTYIFEDGNLDFKKIPQNVKFLSKLLKDKEIKNKIITMDVETSDIENKKRPYCISIYDGENLKTFYITDYKNDEELLIKTSIKFLLREKYNKFKVYLHNFSHFDSAFFINALSDLSDYDLKPLIRDDDIINFKYEFGKGYYITFRDSLLLLPTKLSLLAKSFGFEDKGIFPYLFVNNKNIKMDYIGKFPRFHFFNWLQVYNTSEYNEYKNKYFEYKKLFKNKKWNLREETIKYCENDVIILYKILIKFNEIIFNTFSIDALKYPTLSSLSFAIYRINYLKFYKIPLITGNLYKALKLSYTGGSVDVFKPYGTDIKGYDVNSLYPTVMLQNDMPVGTPIYFEGDIYKYEIEPFGFFEVEVNAPLDLNVPILQKKILTKNGYRTIAPVGTWTGTYFSEEIKEAKKLGYTFKVKNGFIFNKLNIFKKKIL